MRQWLACTAPSLPFAKNPMPNHKHKIKRTKTFTGCLTCRSRGVKCDEQKPTCLRCRNARVHCKGYGVKLIWPGPKEPKELQRMSILDEPNHSLQAVSDKALSRVFGILDLAPRDKTISIGPFGVFPIIRNYAHTSKLSTCSATTKSHLEIGYESQNPVENHSLPTSSAGIIGELTSLEASDTDSESRPLAPIPLSFKPFHTHLSLSPLTTSPIKSNEEQYLMHYWTSFLGYFMLPVNTPSNPFFTIILPTALSSSNRALLHALFAVAAASHANFNLVPQQKRLTGTKHQQLSIRHLNANLFSEGKEYPEVILATIMVLLVADIINGATNDWRVHMRGASTCVQSVRRSAWNRSRDAKVLYQLFLCLEAFRPAYRSLALELEPRELWLTHGEDQSDNFIASDYYMDSIFCIPHHVLKSIRKINRWVYNDDTPSDSELDALELMMIRNDPAATSAAASMRLQWHNQCLWHAATYIYFKRSVQRASVSSVQYLVRQAVENLTVIAQLETGQIVSGIMWPAFMAGVEADDSRSRERIDRYFDKRETLGIGNVKDARQVVQEVWRRRDVYMRAKNVDWHEVMTDLGINIAIS